MTYPRPFLPAQCLWLFFAILVYPMITQAQVAAPAAVETDVDQARALVRELMTTNRIPGLSISVAEDGELVWSEGFGLADLEQQVPVDPSRTKFRIGSVSKPMTTVGLARLYEEGKVDLDRSIQYYLPDFPRKRDTFTLRQLGGHLAGIRHYRGEEFLSNKYYSTVAEGLAMFAQDTLLFPPGTKYSYSSYGFNLISAVMEKAAGRDFLVYMREAVFTPLGLTNTYADNNQAIIPYRSRFYSLYQLTGETVNAPAVDNSYKWAGGGFLSTSEDLVKFGNQLLDNTFLSEETLQEFIRPQRTAAGESTNYGIGFASGRDELGRPWFGHSGGSVGGVTQFLVFPEQRLVIAIVTNASSVRYGRVPEQIAALFME